MFKQLSYIAGAGAVALTCFAMLPASAGSSNSKTSASSSTEKSADPIEVRVCPIMHTPVHGKGAGSEVVGKYKVYFCCKGCPEAFDKLTPAQKLQKAEEAYLIQQHNAEKDKDAKKDQ